MTGIRRSPTACDNMNHGRGNAPVPHCHQCGEVVDRALARRQCSNDQHAVSRRQGSVFCVGCGVQLIIRRV